MGVAKAQHGLNYLMKSLLKNKKHKIFKKLVTILGVSTVGDKYSNNIKLLIKNALRSF